MEFTLENEILTVTVTTSGAQMKSVLRKCDGVEHIWQADPAVWGQHAPILFPYAGRLPEGKMTAKGRLFEGLAAHGFAREMEHALVSHSRDTLILELTDRPETLAKWPLPVPAPVHLPPGGPYPPPHPHRGEPGRGTHGLRHRFSPRLRPALRQKSRRIGLCAAIRFSGIAPVPGDPAPRASQREMLLSGQKYPGNSLDDRLFANDSHCMVGLSSKYLSLTEKGTGRSVRCKIEKFPYVLIWSMPGEPKFVCIEPWESLPSQEGGSIEWNEKPAAAILTPGESRSTTLSTSFLR